MIIIAYVLSLLPLMLNASMFIHLKPPYNCYFWAFQIAAALLSPVLVVLGLLGAGLGWLYQTPFPSGIAARTHATTGLGNSIMDERFNKTEDNTYQSSDFDSDANKVEITVHSGAGNVIVNTN